MQTLLGVRLEEDGDRDREERSHATPLEAVSRTTAPVHGERRCPAARRVRYFLQTAVVTRLLLGACRCGVRLPLLKLVPEDSVASLRLVTPALATV